MKPAGSIVFFTVASGAGCGMVFWLGLLRPLGLLPAGEGWAATAAAVALALTAAGLLSSTLHLGRPERAWRALSQWRSSWLSREGVAAFATLIPGGLFFLAALAGMEGAATLLGLLAAIGAAAMVWCTGMIYAALKPVREWHHPLVAPGYMVFAAFLGAAMLAALSGAMAAPTLLALLFGVAGLLLKRAYWTSIDAAPPLATMESATGLGFIGKVRALDPPHTETNYLLREMGFRIARAHGARLRLIAQVAGFVVPVLLLALSLISGGAVGTVLAALAAALALGGMLVERWLMFAQATHTVTLYYGGARAA